MSRHPVAHWHPRVLSASLLLLLLLLLLEVLVISYLLLLFACHVCRVHIRPRHVWLLGIDVALVDIIWRLSWDIRGVDTILVGTRIGSVKARLVSGVSLMRK